MTSRRIALVSGLLSASLVTPLAAQGLGDTAAREREKRAAQAKAKQDAAKVFTNEDLDKGRPPGAKAESGSTDAQPSPATEGRTPPEPPEDRLADERPFLDAIIAARAEVTRAEGQIRELSGKLNPMSLSYIYGSGGSNDANEELRVREQLRQAESDLQAARQGVEAANRNLQDVRQGRQPGSSEER
ncbi:MAG TPA: hypothetical protein VJ648_13305 [Vicinamibacteria bacterium]|nr:hypothetical protein [Vicinamibacteria bacterium]